MVEVIYLDGKDYRCERKGNYAYYLKIQKNRKYKWTTSKNNYYNILENKIYLLDFVETNEIENNVIRIKYVKIYEKLGDGTIYQKKNKKNIYKEWM